VRGTSNIRVVDGSILPSHSAAGPNALIALMAEKGAKMVKVGPINSNKIIENIYRLDPPPPLKEFQNPNNSNSPIQIRC